MHKINNKKYKDILNNRYNNNSNKYKFNQLIPIHLQHKSKSQEVQ